MEDKHLQEEAQAFNQRIEERETHGFIPDLRRAVKCDYFYKSFWRDPQFVDLYLGENVRKFLGLLKEHGQPRMRILDVGCGSGYISLELARSGYHVVGIDIAEKAIEAAKRTLASNPYQDGFGSLEYRACPIEQIAGPFHAVLFSGILHHFPNPDEILGKASALLSKKGLVICHEPIHERFGHADAAQVALMRGLLAQTGHWYDPEIKARLKSPATFDALVKEIHTEYLTERDPNEAGQSPNDLSSSGETILAALRRATKELHFSLGSSFIYRFLGGIRGSETVVRDLADFVALYEKYMVERGFLQPNHFFFAGQKA